VIREHLRAPSFCAPVAPRRAGRRRATPDARRLPRGRQPDVFLARRADDWLVAFDRDDVVGGALVSVDRASAMLNVIVGAVYRVRYALYTELVRWLGATGLEHMFVSDESALVLPDGLQYLQRILGNRVVNLRLRRAPAHNAVEQ
jgi:hypothetical protein